MLANLSFYENDESIIMDFCDTIENEMKLLENCSLLEERK